MKEISVYQVWLLSFRYLKDLKWNIIINLRILDNYNLCIIIVYFYYSKFI